MSVAGLCDVCGDEVVGTCDRCGSVVCERHYEPSLGYCVECVSELGGESSPGEKDRPDESDTYRF